MRRKGQRPKAGWLAGKGGFLPPPVILADIWVRCRASDFVPKSTAVSPIFVENRALSRARCSAGEMCHFVRWMPFLRIISEVRAPAPSAERTLGISRKSPGFGPWALGPEPWARCGSLGWVQRPYLTQIWHFRWVEALLLHLGDFWITGSSSRWPPSGQIDRNMAIFLTQTRLFGSDRRDLVSNLRLMANTCTVECIIWSIAIFVLKTHIDLDPVLGPNPGQTAPVGADPAAKAADLDSMAGAPKSRICPKSAKMAQIGPRPEKAEKPEKRPKIGPQKGRNRRYLPRVVRARRFFASSRCLCAMRLCDHVPVPDSCRIYLPNRP